VARGVALAALTRRLFIWDLAPVLSLLKATGIDLRYLSGERVDLFSLLDGSPALEPLIAAPVEAAERVRGWIRNKLPS
jgi:hypothetical protein